MKGLSVGECLLEADKRVRETSFDIGSLDHDALAAAWPWFARAAAELLTALPGPGGGPVGAIVERLRGGSAAAVAERLRGAPVVSAPVTPDPRFVAAAGMFDRAAVLVQSHAVAWAPDRDQVAAHVTETVCIAAHVVARAIEDHKVSRALREPGRAGAGVLEGPTSRGALGLVLRHAMLVEDASRVAVQHSGRGATPAVDPQGEARVELAVATWLEHAARALHLGVAGVGDLRDIARVNANIEGHTSAVAHAAAHAGVLRTDQVSALGGPLSRAHQAWAAAAGDWPLPMTSPSLPPSRDLLHAGAELDQALTSITRVGNRWATAAEVTRSTDPGGLLERLAHAHRDLALLAQDYRSAAHQLFDDKRVTVPGRFAHPYTNRVVDDRRLAYLPAGATARMSISTGELTAASGAAANALDTATQMTDAAIRRRARLPLSMTAAEMDAAVRHRVQDAQRQLQLGPEPPARARIR